MVLGYKTQGPQSSLTQGTILSMEIVLCEASLGYPARQEGDKA